MNRSALILLVMVVSSSVGCESSRRAGFPRQSYDEKKLIITLEEHFKLEEQVKEYYTEKKKDDADQTKLRGMRDEFINSRIALINLNYVQFVSEFAVNKQTIDTLSEMGVLGLNLAGTAVVSAATKTTLSAISAGIAGAHVSIDKNFFYDKTVPVLVTAMNARRKEALLPIEKGIQKSVDKYSMIKAITDLDDYYFAGTFIGALQAMQKNASEKDVEAGAEMEVIAIADLRRSISVWLQTGDTEARENRLLETVRAKYPRVVSPFEWLSDAPPKDVQVIADSLGIVELSSEELSAHSKASMESVKEGEEDLARRVAKMASLIAKDRRAVISAALAWMLGPDEADVALFNASVYVKLTLLEQDVASLLGDRDPTEFPTAEWMLATHLEPGDIAYLLAITKQSHNAVMERLKDAEAIVSRISYDRDMVINHVIKWVDAQSDSDSWESIHETAHNAAILYGDNPTAYVEIDGDWMTISRWLKQSSNNNDAITLFILMNKQLTDAVLEFDFEKLRELRAMIEGDREAVPVAAFAWQVSSVGEQHRVLDRRAFELIQDMAIFGETSEFEMAVDDFCAADWLARSDRTTEEIARFLFADQEVFSPFVERILKAKAVRILINRDRRLLSELIEAWLNELEDAEQFARVTEIAQRVVQTSGLDISEFSSGDPAVFDVRAWLNSPPPDRWIAVFIMTIDGLHEHISERMSNG